MTFELRRGRTLGIVGESGSGKTTLALALLKLVASHGEIHFNKQSINQLTGKGACPLFGARCKSFFRIPSAR